MIRFENRQMYVFNLSLEVSGWQLNHGQRNPGTFIYFAFENNPPPPPVISIFRKLNFSNSSRNTRTSLRILKLIIKFQKRILSRFTIFQIIHAIFQTPHQKKEIYIITSKKIPRLKILDPWKNFSSRFKLDNIKARLIVIVTRNRYSLPISDDGDEVYNARKYESVGGGEGYLVVYPQQNLPSLFPRLGGDARRINGLIKHAILPVM